MREEIDSWDIAEEKFASEIYIEVPLDDYCFEEDDGIISREKDKHR